MMQKLSVIIPARNAESTLERCLQSVFASLIRPDEVLVVDDGSSDATSAIAARFPCRILKTQIGKGPMQPRFAGAREALYPFLVFVDADVCVQPDTFSKILGHFQNPVICAVTGILSASSRDENFFSAFKNEYMHYIFSKQPRQNAFLYGSLWAIRRDDLIFFDPISEPFGSLVSDSEMGLRLSKQGRTLILDHTLEVQHLKVYSFLKLLKNDFIIPFLFAGMFLSYFRHFRPENRRFSHASLEQTAATALAFASPCVLALAILLRSPLWVWGLPLAGWTLFYFHWFPFLNRVRGHRGFLFVLQTVLFLPLDAAVMFCGMLSGFLYFGWLLLFHSFKKINLLEIKNV